MATWKKWTSTVLVNGQPEPNVEVHVYEPGTTNEITVYEDEGVTPITQPILTDSQGRYAFFVDVDTYPEIRLYLEKDGVDFSEANEDLDGVPVPGAGAGAGTFLELTDTPSSYVGRGGDVVLVKTTEDGIETQPWPVTGSTLNFFLSDDAADIGSYYYMYPTESGDGYSELTSPSLSTGDDQLLWSFVTEAGEPGVEVLALGAYTTTLFLKKTGNKDVRVYWKLFKRDTGGTETEILQSAVSDYLTSDNSQYLISAYLNEDQTLDPTDRLVLKLFANVSGTGTDVTVTLTMEGDYDSRLTINVLSSAFNLDRLSDVTLTSPSDDEVLAYDSGSGKWINQTAGEAGVLAADGSVPLSGDLNANSHSIGNLLSLYGSGKRVHFASQYASVQAAIDAASPGDLIIFDDLFEISTGLVCEKDVHFRGLGWGTGIKYTSTSGTALSIQATDPSRRTRVTLRDFAIFGPDSGVSENALLIKNVNFMDITDLCIGSTSSVTDQKGFKGYGIRIEHVGGTENPRISGCQICGVGNGIELDGVHDLIISDNHFEDCGHAIYSYNPSGLVVDIFVIGNIMEDGLDDYIYLDGNINRIFISDNGIAAVPDAKDGIDLHLQPTIGDSVALISDNDFDLGLEGTGHAACAIRIKDMKNVMINGNKIGCRAGDTYPIRGIILEGACENITIEGNHFFKIGQHAIYAYDNIASLDRCVIQGNLIHNVNMDNALASAILLGKDPNTADNCSVIGNAIVNDTQTMYKGVNIFGDWAIVVGNRIHNYSAGDISVSGSNKVVANNLSD